MVELKISKLRKILTFLSGCIYIWTQYRLHSVQIIARKIALCITCNSYAFSCNRADKSRETGTGVRAGGTTGERGKARDNRQQQDDYALHAKKAVRLNDVVSDLAEWEVTVFALTPAGWGDTGMGSRGDVAGADVT